MVVLELTGGDHSYGQDVAIAGPGVAIGAVIAGAQEIVKHDEG